MAPSRSNQRPPGLVRQLSLQQAPPSNRRGPFRRQLSEEERPISKLLQSALRVTASALGPGLIADTKSPSPPPPPPTAPISAPRTIAGRLRPVRVAWAELRRSTPEPSDAVAVVAQRVSLNKPSSTSSSSTSSVPNHRPPHCLPALARANLDIFLAHSGLSPRPCSPSEVAVETPPAPIERVVISPRSTTLSPRDPKPPPLLLLPNRPNLIPSSQLSASARRVNFRNSSFRTINRSLSDTPSTETTPKSVPEGRVGRVLSAPTHRPNPLAPPRPMLRAIPRRGAVQTSVESDRQSGSEQAGERNIRSAPPRRRLKVSTTGASRRKGGGRRGEESSGDEEVEEPPGKERVGSAGSRGRRGLRVGTEIVTMVSLVSPEASSDSEDDCSSRPPSSPPPPSKSTPGGSGWQTPSTPTRTPSNFPLSSAIVCARKITKSVSFQTRPSVPGGVLRRSSSQLVLALAAGQLSSSAVAAAASTSSDHLGVSVNSSAATTASSSSSSASASQQPPDQQHPTVVLKTPLHAAENRAKRRLARSKAVQRQDSNEVSTTSRTSGVEEGVATNTRGAPQAGSVTMGVSTLSSPTQRPQRPPVVPPPSPCPDEEAPKPKFETPKEKECWHLYRKMCEKGLTVSFDTVLRGMLTPTEYRLRRGALLSTC